MPRESAKKAVREFFQAIEAEDRWDVPPTDGSGPFGDAFVEQAAAAFEDYARDWAKELGIAWDRRGERPEEPGPGVPVLQPQFDELLEELARYRQAVEAAGPDVPPGLLVIALAEMKKRLAGYEAERCEHCGARFAEARKDRSDDDEEWYRDLACHPCVENERLRDLVKARERDFKEAAGELMVEIPEPGTVMAKLLSANVLLRHRVANLVAKKDLT